jgi:hypothetical protein
MNSSESISQGLSQPNNGCETSAQLSAYYDGELDPAAAARIEQHLPGCDECRSELNEIRELSVLAARIGEEGMSSGGLRKIHRLVDLDQGYFILRIAGALTGLAASVMVIGSVWLREIPAKPAASGQIVIIDSASPAWNVAMNIDVPPLPRSSADVREQPMVADSHLAAWMLDDLSGSSR